MKVMTSPTLGVALLTVLATTRSACWGVSVALPLLLPVFGVELVGVADRGHVGLRVGADHRGGDGAASAGLPGLTVPTSHTPVRVV